MKNKILGIISGGLMGSDPYHQSSWSGSSAYFFKQLEAQESLSLAFGADISKLQMMRMAVFRYHKNKEVWRRRLYMSMPYRYALQKRINEKLSHIKNVETIVQLGSYINSRNDSTTNSLIASYQDGNVVDYYNSPFTPQGIKQDTKLFDECFKFEKQVANDMDIIFTTSESLRRSFIDNFDIPQEKVCNIGIGINIDDSKIQVLPSKNYNSFELVFIGKDFDRKGGDILVKAMDHVQEKFPEVVLHIIGPDTLPVVCEGKRYIQFHGFLNRSDEEQKLIFDQILGQSSLFILPSLYEPFGLAPLEAMMYGVPAVVSNQPALAENISNNFNGYVSETGDSADLAQKIILALSDPDKLKVMGMNGRDFVKSHFTWKIVVEKMLNQLSSLER